ncbi:hypothetical protein EVAR_92616_1 [Eumeta japonica]|uniref:Uncharacterized protein n=1 Tax=Eumeta variegata TaxID=151549 RepID=A0A4C1SZF4_EUMVA|nr:hypothetical protein EVAR_92616_1 [Eumeta japonica]
MPTAQYMWRVSENDRRCRKGDIRVRCGLKEDVVAKRFGGVAQAVRTGSGLRSSSAVQAGIKLQSRHSTPGRAGV